MTNDLARIAELAEQGFCCSQILAMMGLEAQGKTNPDLVRAVQGLCGGIGSSGDVCGALTGGACALGLFAGRGTPAETTGSRMNPMIRDLVDWFATEYGSLYGGIHCSEIVAGSPASMRVRCPTIIAGTWEKVKELLLCNGYRVEVSEG